MEEIRGIAMNLRPAVLDDLGAASAVSWFCREFAQSYPTLTLREAVAVVDADIPERLRTAVVPSLQEPLNNLAEHAQARSGEHTSELQSPFNLVCRPLLA